MAEDTETLDEVVVVGTSMKKSDLTGAVASVSSKVLETGSAILAAVRASVAGQRQQLAYFQGLLPALAMNVVERNRRTTGRQTDELIATSVRNRLRSARQRIDALADLLDAISPEATLRRGYSITRAGGHAVLDGSTVAAGTVLTTTFACGREVQSVAK